LFGINDHYGAYDGLCIYRGSQEERVVILKLALAHKGASTNIGHYDLTPQSGPSATDSASTQAHGPPDAIEDEEGIHL
jgi:hypothetical protein